MRFIPVLCIAVLAGAFYHPVREAGFVYDDLPYVVENPAVLSPTLSNVFMDTFPPGRPDSGLYRPLTTLSLAVDRLLPSFGMEHAFVAHAHNVMLHVAVCALLYLLLTRLTGGVPALMGAGLYAVHPVLTESVAWVSGRSEILVGLCCLLGVGCMIWPGVRDAYRAAGLALITLCALLCKESAIMLPFIWLAAARVLRKECLHLDRPVRVLVPALVVAAAALVLRLLIAGGLSPEVRTFAGIESATRYRIVFMTLFRYAQLVVCPINQTVHWPPYPMEIARLQVLAGVALTLLGVTTAAIGLARRRVWGLGAAWFLLALLPASNLILPIGTIMAERFLYLPTMGAAIALSALVAQRWPRCGPRCRAVTMACVAVITLVAGAATFKRAAAWRDEVSLWRAGMQAYPDDLVSQVAAAFYLAKQGDDASFADLQQWWPGILDNLPGRGVIPPKIAARIEWVQLELMRYEARRSR
ncbi:MAG: hypothetical protein O2923_00340 [Verrucomicrobia bacterium]|nr:hypothetical protein [Verrucomicrobiota bacterium]MDA1085584.1 hypothetical protein [Verrucomicrobiota bacterium]